MNDYNDKRSILIVDDIIENVDVLAAILEPEYRIKVALNGTKALEIAGSRDQPELILLDVMMPDMNGFEVCSRLKENPSTKRIPVIFVTALGEVADESRGFLSGGVDYITKPVSPHIVLARVKTHLALFNQARQLEEKVRERTRELNDTRVEIIRRLSRAAEYKDYQTGMHVIHMSKFCQSIAREIGLPEEEVELIVNAAPMHDVGKIGIPDHILLKPGELDEEEWKIMQTHCEIGYNIIGEHQSDLLRYAGLGALTHHEKWDGTGYPRGWKGGDIPLIGRIIAVADVFDALTSDRPYKKAWPADQAVEHIRNESGRHFYPLLVAAFMKRLPEILKVREDYKN